MEKELKENTKKVPIFEDRKALLDIWKTLIERMEHGADLIWRGAQYFFVLISAIISVNLIGLGTVLGLEDVLIQYLLLVLSLVFPILIIALTCVGWLTLKRRFRRMLEIVTHIGKVESLLGLSADISDYLQELSVFSQDTYLFERYVKSRAKHNSEKDFIEGELGGGIEGGNMYTDLKKVYWVFIFVGVFLTIFNSFLIISAYSRLVNCCVVWL